MKWFVVRHRIKFVNKIFRRRTELWKAAEDKCSLSSFSLHLSLPLSLSRPRSLPLSHVLHYTSYAKWGRAHCKQTQHKQMLCQALAGAALMQTETVTPCLVITEQRFFRVPSHICNHYISHCCTHSWHGILCCWQQFYYLKSDRLKSKLVLHPTQTVSVMFISIWKQRHKFPGEL